MVAQEGHVLTCATMPYLPKEAIMATFPWQSLGNGGRVRRPVPGAE